MVEPVLAQLRKQYPNDVQTVFRHFPLNNHPLSQLAAQASEAAGKQGKFFEYTNYLFEHQNDWSKPDASKLDEFKKYLSDTATRLGLDAAQFEKDLESDEVRGKITGASQLAEEMKLDHTPFIFVNGNDLGETSFGALPAIVELYKLQPRMYENCPALLPDTNKKVTAVISTTKGDIEVELYADKAPMTVSSFVFLAQEGWYNNVVFHRVLPDFVAQTGDPTGTGSGGPGYEFGLEVHPELTFAGEGYLGMANSSPDTNGSQFFISYDALPMLDGKYTVFGKVTKGMDVVKQLTAFDPSKEQAPKGELDKIKGIKVTVQ